MDADLMKELLPFIRLPDLTDLVAELIPDHLKWATRKCVRNQVLRFDALLTIPLGEQVVNTMTGEFMEWTPELVEATKARQAEWQAQLDKM